MLTANPPRALNEIRLYTNAAFATNLEFYQRSGFIEYRRGSMLTGSTAVFMRKMLEGAGQRRGGVISLTIK